MTVPRSLAAPTTGVRGLPKVKRGLLSIGTWLAGHLWSVLLLLTLPAVLPLYSLGLPRSSDGLTHLGRLGLLDFYFRHGTFFPRWFPGMLLGHGYPALNFYGPSTYYLVEGLHLAGASTYWAFGTAFALLVVAAGMGMFWFARDLFRMRYGFAALLAAVAYIYAPYLLTNVYSRGAIAEVGAQALLPWILWSYRRLTLAGESAPYVLPCSLTLGTLAFTHNISLLLVPPLLLAYTGLLWWHTGRRRDKLGWLALSFLFALGISAFFWLPVVFERGYLKDTAYQIARGMLARSAWNWRNILGASWAYAYGPERPVRLGLVQVILGIAGAILARRRDPEWFFFILVGLVFGLAMTGWALPLWLGSNTLVVIQYLYRLLTPVSFALAILTGGLIAGLNATRRQGGIAALLIVIIVLANQPRLAWINTFSAANTDPRPATVAQVEYDNNVEGDAENLSSVQEFRPIWTGQTLNLDPTPVATGEGMTLSPRQGNAYDVTVDVTSETGGPLRFSSLFFPGWRVTLDGRETLAPYPSTNLGLLTVDVPAGPHAVSLRWTGTDLELLAAAISLLALALLGLQCLLMRRKRWAAVFPLALCLLGLAAALWQRPWDQISAPHQSAVNGGVRLAGLRAEQLNRDYLEIYPYWQVAATPDGNWRAKWQLLDSGGNVVSQIFAEPYFNSAQAKNWPRGTLISDAYELPLPPGLAAGTYRLALNFGPEAEIPNQTPAIVGSVGLSSETRPDSAPQHVVDIRAGDSIRLAGFDSEIRGQTNEPLRPDVLVARAGQYVKYRLFWQALEPVTTNYHGFIHLLDVSGRAIVQQDQVPGPAFAPPRLWTGVRLAPDDYQLNIPQNTPSGLYFPTAGLYDFKTLNRLPMMSAEGKELGDAYQLPPIKVLGNPGPAPEHAASAQLADWAVLTGYDLALPAPQVHPGETITVTLHYRSTAAADRDYARFLHLYSPSLGMAGQYDSRPQSGANPTWAWVPGETILDQIVLHVAEDAVPGTYTLSTGLYLPADNGARLPITDGAGKPLPDSQVVLTSIDVRR